MVVMRVLYRLKGLMQGLQRWKDSASGNAKSGRNM
jgi:hypothetical protein